jgi:HPt (histidine-containing phosphotransfer) domain-containing protein
MEVLSRCGAIIVPSDSVCVEVEDRHSATILDFSVIDGYRSTFEENFHNILNEMIELYLSEVTVGIQNCYTELASGNQTGLAKEAHSIKGASATIGASRMMKLSADLECLVKSGMLDDAQGRLHEMSGEFERTKQALNQLISH